MALRDPSLTRGRVLCVASQFGTVSFTGCHVSSVSAHSGALVFAETHATVLLEHTSTIGLRGLTCTGLSLGVSNGSAVHTQFCVAAWPPGLMRV